MRLGFTIVAGMLLASPAAVAAQDSGEAISATSERRLSPEQVEAILQEAAAKRVAAERQIDPAALDEAPAPQIHGQVGFTVGTGGYREAFGTAVYPLGEDGVAIISLDFVNWGNRHFRR
jgi:hypothetical protein